MKAEDLTRLIRRTHYCVREAERYLLAQDYAAATVALVEAAACTWRLHSPAQESDPDGFLADWRGLASTLLTMGPSVLRQAVRLLDELRGDPSSGGGPN
jgi:hypothetical protein